MKTANQINAPQCGEASPRPDAAEVLEKLFAAFGIKLKTLQNVTGRKKKPKATSRRRRAA